MLNRITSVLTGCAAGIAVIFLMDMVPHAVYPIPEGLDPMKPDDLKKIVELMPAGAFILLLLGGFLGGLTGGAVCGIISKENKLRNCLVVGGILTVLGLLNAFMVPHPAWFRAASFIVYIAGALLGSKLIRTKTDAQKS